MEETEPSGVVVVLMTAPDSEIAEELAHTLVTERLAACANIVPGVTSIYQWEGAVTRDTEVMIVLKATMSAVPELERRAVELHPYDVPEFLVLPVGDGHDPYLSWVRGEVRG